ncbi:hypothetical protein D3C72_2181590 [compost metagenome]
MGLSSEGVRLSGGYSGPVLVAVSNGPAGGIIDGFYFKKRYKKFHILFFENYMVLVAELQWEISNIDTICTDICFLESETGRRSCAGGPLERGKGRVRACCIWSTFLAA